VEYCVKLTTLLSKAAVCAALVLGLASVAEAQASRTWVSGVGDDANPCSRTAPCKTFAGAISKTAAGGFINVLDSAGYGAVTITKSITIDGEGAHAGILVSGTNGINVNAANIVVNLRNLSIESPASFPGIDGINVFNAAEVHIEKCWISGFSNNAINFHPSSGGEGYISDTMLINNMNGGVIVNTGRVSVDRLRAESNSNAVVVNGNAIATVRNSIAIGGGAGFGAVVSPAAVINVENSLATGNQFGLYAASGATVRVSNSQILSNTTGLFNDGSSFIVSLQGNSVVGNPTAGAFTSTVAKQ
jgi:hypothetical protein